jgi:hypothetical protein
MQGSSTRIVFITVCSRGEEYDWLDQAQENTRSSQKNQPADKERLAEGDGIFANAGRSADQEDLGKGLTCCVKRHSQRAAMCEHRAVEYFPPALTRFLFGPNMCIRDDWATLPMAN